MRRRPCPLDTLRLAALLGVVGCGHATESVAPDTSAPPPAAAWTISYATNGTRANVGRGVVFANALVTTPDGPALNYSVTSGALPFGIALSSAGSFSGSATASGAYQFSVRASSPQGTATQAFTLMVNPPSLAGTVQTVAITGSVTRRPITFSIYLPPGYAGGGARYPVIYHLHGIGGTHGGNQATIVPLSLEASVSAGLMEPAIIVFPDGYGDSFWAGDANADKPAEVNVVQEILPYVDGNFRTVARRERRVMQGFSMGGFGAAKFAAKFPTLFSVCVIYDGAMLDWTRMQTANTQQAASIFGGSATQFDQFSPYFWLAQNAALLRSTSAFRDAVGALVVDNDRWRGALTTAAVTSEFVHTGLPHAIGPLLDAQGANSWAFIAQRFAATP